MLLVRNYILSYYFRFIRGFRLPREIIKYSVHRHYNKIVLVDRDRQFTYGQLYERAERLISLFLELGLKKGDKIGVLIYNCSEYFEIRMACFLAGFVLVPIVWDMELEYIIQILNDCDIKVLIYHPEILKDSLGGLKEKTNVAIFIQIDRGSEKSSYEYLLSNIDRTSAYIDLEPTDVASINFTSGTSGRPKGIILTHKSWINSFYNYILNSANVRYKKYVVLHILALATAGGSAFLPVLWIGCKNIILRKFDIDKAISLIMQHKVNGIFISPSYLALFLDVCKNKRLSLPIEGIFVGTEPLPLSKFKEAIQTFGPVVQQGYGMAEVLPPLTLICSRDYEKSGGIQDKLLLSVGRPLWGVTIRIIDDLGRSQQRGELGRIIIKSKTVSRGYWNNKDLNRSRFRDGWFYTDDYGYIDTSGYLYIMGRDDDIVRKDGGRVFFAREVEEVLHTHPAILETFVFLDKDNNIISYVSLRRTSSTTEDELIRFCRDRLKDFLVPKRIVILPELPKTASGKIDKFRLKRQYHHSIFDRSY